jgi:hypothetical protein
MPAVLDDRGIERDAVRSAKASAAAAAARGARDRFEDALEDLGTRLAIARHRLAAELTDNRRLSERGRSPGQRVLVTVAAIGSGPMSWVVSRWFVAYCGRSCSACGPVRFAHEAALLTGFAAQSASPLAMLSAVSRTYRSLDSAPPPRRATHCRFELRGRRRSSICLLPSWSQRTYSSRRSRWPASYGHRSYL